jgi:cytochrome c oxidase assembly protein subunit 15
METADKRTAWVGEMNPWLHRFAFVTALATLCLIGIGGLVTSHGVGMAVPDWPNTYGYNLFLFPFSKWIGGIFYEHTHRLAAALVGVLTTILAVWLWARDTRGRERWLGVGTMVLVLVLMGVRQLPVYITLACLAPIVWAASFWQIVRQRRRPSLVTRWLGVVAFSAVILQGVLGGLRVVLFKDQIGIFHAALAQLFFVLLCAIALLTRGGISLIGPTDRRLGFAVCATTCLIFFQLLLGATMRHQHAGLAIPDFPLAYGKLWPSVDAASVAAYNRHRIEVLDANPITAFQIQLQMLHRCLALLILVGVSWSAWIARRRATHPSNTPPLQRHFTVAWIALIFVQILLGAATIWSNKAADVATAHVLVGALSLAFGAMLSIICVRGLVVSRANSVVESSPAQDCFGHQASAATQMQ